MNTRASLLLVHGLGGYSGRWRAVSDFFTQHNISSYTIDLKGFGGTEGLRGHIDSFSTYFNDINSLYNIIARENKGKKIFMVGESLGALIAFLFSIKNPDLFDGLICISPAFRSRLKFAFADYLKIFSSLLYNPKKQFTVPFTSQMCTQDETLQKQMDEDKREHRFATSNFLIQALLAQIKVKFYKDKLKIPTLFLLAGKDQLVDPAESRKVFNALKIKDKQLIDYPDMYHALSIERGRERVFTDMLTWLHKRI